MEVNNYPFNSPSSERPLELAGTQNSSNQICGTPPPRRRRCPARSPPTDYIQQPQQVRLESPSSPIPIDPLPEQTPPRHHRRRPARSPPTDYIQQPQRVRLESP